MHVLCSCASATIWRSPRRSSRRSSTWCRKAMIPRADPGRKERRKTGRRPTHKEASARFQILAEERDGIVDRLDLHGVGIVDAVLIAPHVDEAVHIVLIALPLRFLAELDHQLVAHPE